MFEFIGFLHINALVVSIQVDDDGNGHSGFGGCNGDDENCEEQTVGLAGVQVFVEGDEVDVYAIQHELNGHEHGNHVPSGEHAVHADEEERSAHEQDM
jgi:hypothetical protein